MKGNKRRQNWINAYIIIIICYLIISLLMLLFRGWEILDIILFIINFATIYFIKKDVWFINAICSISIFSGFISFFFLKGFVNLFGLILAIFTITFLIVNNE